MGKGKNFSLTIALLASFLQDQLTETINKIEQTKLYQITLGQTRISLYCHKDYDKSPYTGTIPS